MKILWLSHRGDLEGAELSLLEAARGLVSRGETVQAVLPAPGPLAKRLEQISVPVFVVGYSWWMGAAARKAFPYRLRRLLRNLLALPGLAALFRRLRPDVVVSNTLTIPAGAVVARRLRIPHVWYIHEFFGSLGHGLFFDFGESASLALIDRLSARVIVCSCAVQKQVQKRIPLKKLRLVYGAVETVLISDKIPSEDNRFRLVQVGRLAPGKRQEDAIRAVHLLAEKGFDIRLTLVGREVREYGDFLRNLVLNLGVEDRVEFVPFTENPFPRVAEADLALICSTGEGFGRVTVEAMKLGKPVVGAASGATDELIVNGWNGLLYPPGDVHELAERIETLYRNRALLREMGRNAKEWSNKTFNLKKYTSSLLEVFQDALESQAR